MRSFWIFWRRRHKVGERLCDEDAHELCENDATREAIAPPRRCFLKSRSSGGVSCGAGGHTAIRSGAAYHPAGSTKCTVTESSSDDDDDDEYDDDEFAEDQEEVEAAEGGDEDAEEEDGEESLACNVCERSFPSGSRLSQHQQRKRHFGCPVCDALFPSLLALEHHRESLEHWSDDEEREPPQRSRAPLMRTAQRGRRRSGDDFYDEDDLEGEEDESSSEEETESDSDGAELDSDSQDLERLL